MLVERYTLCIDVVLMLFDILATQREIFVLLCDGCAIYILYRLSGMYICFLCDDGCGYYIKNRQNTKKTARFAECFYPDTRQSNHFSIS